MSNNRVLWFMSFAQFLAMQVWFNFSAVMPYIEKEWELTASQSGIIIAFFQIGYVLAIIIYSILIEKYHPKYFIIYGAFTAGIAGVLFTFLAQEFWTGLLLRMLSGIGIAGIYVPGIRLLSSLFAPYERGKAVGIYVGSLVIGSGFSLLVSSLFIESIGWRGVVLVTSLFSIIAGYIVLKLNIPFSRNSQHSVKLSWGIFKKVFRKQNLLVNVGYSGHSWELYAMWAWIGPFLVYYFHMQGFEETEAIRYGNLAGAIVIMVGGIATYIGGRLSDAFGRVKIANLFLIISIACSLSVGWFSNIPIILMLLLVLVYGFTIVADSPIYNVTIGEVCDPEILGLALGVQSVLGYTVTIFSPLLFGLLLDAFSWGTAFTVIGAVAIIAPICMSFVKVERGS
ncbi:MFS transporter [Lysinibacillus sp. LZ02]|uniref:MFS transporter n=1 Tax=Lysinibacillus sp. LZ02 TaxID=3420668 RepID=UPI003D361299